MVAGQGFYNVVRDPWNSPPAGIADDFSAPTCPLKLRSAHYVQTNTLGHCAIAVSPALDGSGTWAYTNIATATASDTISAWAGSDHGDIAALTAAYTSWRPVSIGIKAYYVGPAQTTAGIMTVAPIQGLTAPITQLPTSITELADLPGAVNVSAATMSDSLNFVGHMFDRVAFQPLGTGLHAYTFPSCVIALTGGLASTNVLRVEVTFNVEFLPLYTNIVSAQSATAADTSSAALGATRRLGSFRIGDMKKMLAPSMTFSTAASAKKKKAKTATNTRASYAYIPRRSYGRRKRSRATAFGGPPLRSISRQLSYGS